MRNSIAKFLICFVFVCIFWTIVSINFDLSKNTIDINNIVSILGLVITSIAFIAGTYFILLAIDAYSYVKDIKTTKDDITNTRDLLIRMQNEIASQNKALASSTADILDNFLSHQVYINSLSFPGIMEEEMRGYVEKRRNEALAIRARVLSQNKYLSSSRRISLINELGAVGSTSDIKLLEIIISDENESSDIRDTAKKTIEFIRVNFNKK